MAASPKLRTVTRAAQRRVVVDQQFRQAVLDAHVSGHSLRAIAEAAGLSHVRVLQIIREAD